MKAITTNTYEEFVNIHAQLWEQGYTMPNGTNSIKKTKSLKNPKTHDTVTIYNPWWLDRTKGE